MSFNFSIIFGLLFSFSALAQTTIYDVRADKTLTMKQLAKSLGYDNQVIVLGEYHYTPAIQKAQAEVIAKTSKSAPSIGWEFFPRVKAQDIVKLFGQFIQGKITAINLLDSIPGPRHDSYAPIIELAKSKKASFFATNYTREQKRPVTRGGISKLDPKLLPNNYSNCSRQYYERFEAAMGGPGHGINIGNYFDSQCLTDNIIAESVNEIQSTAPIYLVVGSFHSDYNFGTVAQISHRMVKSEVVNIKFTIKAYMGNQTLKDFSNHKDYGPIADYVIIAD